MIQAFYVLLFSACFFLVYALSTTGAPLPGKWHLWQNLLLLALVPTVVSNLTLVLLNQGDRFYDDIDPRFDGAADGSTRRGALHFGRSSASTVPRA